MIANAFHFETLLKLKTPVLHAAIYVGLAIRQSGYFLCELGTDHHTLPSDQVYPFAAIYHHWSMYWDLLTSLAAECIYIYIVYICTHIYTKPPTSIVQVLIPRQHVLNMPGSHVSRLSRRLDAMEKSNEEIVQHLEMSRTGESTRAKLNQWL